MKKLLLLLCLIATPALADRMAVVDGTTIVNIIEAEPGFSLPNMSVVPDAGYAIGGTVVNGAYTPPAAPVAPPRLYDFLTFMALFNTDEQAAIVNSADTQVKLFLLMATGAKSIDPTDPRTAQGLDLLAAKGLITADRETAIKTAMGPQ